MKHRNEALGAAGIAALGFILSSCIISVHRSQMPVTLSKQGTAGSLFGDSSHGRLTRGARMQLLNAEEAAVDGQPQAIDHGVPQAQLRDEENDEKAALQGVTQGSEMFSEKGKPGIHKYEDVANSAFAAPDDNLAKYTSRLSRFMSKEQGAEKAAVADFDAKFEIYERGNPYWDASATFALQDDDADNDGAGGDSAGKSSLASGGDEAGKSGGEVVNKPLAHKEPKEDVIVKFDRYLAKQWSDWLKAQQQQAALRSSSRARRPVLAGAVVAPAKKHWDFNRGADSSVYKRRIDNDVSYGDWLE